MKKVRENFFFHFKGEARVVLSSALANETANRCGTYGKRFGAKQLVAELVGGVHHFRHDNVRL